LQNNLGKQQRVPVNVIELMKSTASRNGFIGSRILEAVAKISIEPVAAVNAILLASPNDVLYYNDAVARALGLPFVANDHVCHLLVVDGYHRQRAREEDA
jgi:hypothetical protein